MPVNLPSSLLRQARSRKLMAEVQPEWDDLQARVDDTLGQIETSPEPAAVPEVPFASFDDFMGAQSGATGTGTSASQYDGNGGDVAGDGGRSAIEPISSGMDARGDTAARDLAVPFKSLDDFLGYKQQQQPEPVAPTMGAAPITGAESVPSNGVQPVQRGAVGDPADRAALASGLDEEGARILRAVRMTEGASNGEVGDNGNSFGHYQFHARGELPAFGEWLQKQGIDGDPRQLANDLELSTQYAASTYLGQAIQAGRAAGLSGADLATYVQRTGQRSVNPEKTGANYAALSGGSANVGSVQGPMPAAGQSTSAAFAAGSLTPDQFTAGATLSSEEAYAACGPAAAVAFARRMGRNPTLDEAVGLAREVGWTPGQGMAGPQSQVNLLQKMGVAASLQGVDPARIAADVQRGNPVTIDTPGHYFVAERYDPESGKFDFGNSAKALKAAAGQTWFTIQELANLGMGAARSAIHLDNPESPSPSVVAGRSSQFKAENAPELVQAVDSVAQGTDRIKGMPVAQALREGNVMAYQSDESGIIAPGDEPLGGGDGRNIGSVEEATGSIQEGAPPSGGVGPGGVQSTDTSYTAAPLSRDTRGDYEPAAQPAGPAIPYGVAGNIDPGDFELNGPANTPAGQTNGAILGAESGNQGLGSEDVFRNSGGATAGTASRDALVGGVPTSSYGGLTAPSPVQQGGAVEPGVPPAPEAPASSGNPIVDLFSDFGRKLSEVLTPQSQSTGLAQAGQDIQQRQATMPGTPQADALAQEPMPFEQIAQTGQDIGSGIIAMQEENDRARARMSELMLKPDITDDESWELAKLVREQVGDVGGVMGTRGVRGVLGQAPREILEQAARVGAPEARQALEALPQAQRAAAPAAGIVSAAQADDAGRPIIAYHATDKDFTGPIRPSEYGDIGPGVYMHTNPDSQPGAFGGVGGNIRKIEIDPSAKLATWDQWVAETEKFKSTNPNYWTDEASDSLAAQGYNGVRASNSGGEEIVIFPESLDKIRNATAGTPGGLLPAIDGVDPKRRDKWVQDQQGYVESLRRYIDMFGKDPQYADRVAKWKADLATAEESLSMLTRQVETANARDEFARSPLGSYVSPEVQAVGRVTGTGIGAAYEESQQEGSTPQSIVNAGLGGAATGLVNEVGRRRIGLENTARVNRAVQKAGDTADEAPSIPRIGGGLYVGDSRPRTQAAISEALAKGEPITLNSEQEIARLRLDKFPAEIRDELTEAAQNADWFRTQRRGVVSDDAVQVASENMYASIDDVIKRGAAGKAYNPEETVAIRNLLAGQAEVVQSYAERLTGELTKTERSRLVAEQLAEAQKLTGLFEVVEGARAEAGRTLRQYREYARSLKDNPTEAGLRYIKQRFGSMDKAEEAVDEYVRLVQSGATPVELASFLRSVKPGWQNRLNILRYGSMLSATTTHLTNALGGVIGLGLDAGLRPVAAGLDAARAGVTGGPRTRYMGEASEIGRGMLEGTMVGLRDMGSTLWYGINPNDVSKIDNIRGGFGSGNRVVDAVAEGPLRALSAADAFFTAVSLGGHTRAIAYRKATQEGLTGTARAARIQDITENLYRNLDVLDEASGQARRAVLQEDRAAVRGIMAAREGINNAVPYLGDVVMPFVKTPINILAQGLEMSPAGVVSVIKDARAGRVGDATDTAARALFGTALMATAGTFAMNGMMTGGYPDDAKERSTLPPGWQPYSLKMGDRYIGYGNLGPIGIPLSAAVILAEAKKQGKPIESGETVMKMLKYMGDQTFMRGLSDFVKAFNDPTRYGENIVENLVTQFTPYASLGRQVQRALGMAQKDPHGAMEALLATYPMTAGSVPDRTDSRGKTVMPSQTGIEAFVSPVRVGREEPDQVLAVLRKSGLGIGAPPKALVVEKGRTVELTESQRQMFKRFLYAELRDSVGDLADPEIAERTMGRARDRARSMVLDTIR